MATPVRTILIAPLDWGLGHTTRCIPVIRHLLTLGHTVLFAGNQHQQAFVAAQCPRVVLRNLEGYNVKYHSRWLMTGLFFQIPRLISAIRREHAWLQQLAQEIKIDGIISDNRYGLWHPQISCVIMTHQPAVQTGLGSIADCIVRKLHYRFLEIFTQCWIVDVAGAENLADRLSHPWRLPRNARFIGWLSQLSVIEQAAAPMRYKCLVLLSGPEPQRTTLADALWAQMSACRHNIAFVEGALPAQKRQDIPPHIHYFGQADAALVADLMQSSELVICRSGYSTLMDLVLCRKRAALIPTPGQTEQEYLAASLSERNVFHAPWPLHLPVDEAIEAMLCKPQQSLKVDGAFTQFIPALEEWLHTLSIILP